EQKRKQLWESWKEWARQSQSSLHEWLTERTALERKLESHRKDALARFGIDAARECAGLEPLLRTSRDIFDFELRRYSRGRTLTDILSAFRMPMCDSLADWDDLQAFARNWSDACHITSLPSLKRSAEEPAEQQVLPVNPPSRVVLRYGTAAGPADAIRFQQELGRASFYCGMNSELSSTDRLLGDPMLPHFWACLYANLLSRPAGVARLIRTGSEDLAPRLNLILRFWNRYDCLLAMYHERLASDLKEAQDLYVACWESSFSIEPPHFLYLYDLERSGDSLLRVCASRSAAAVTERLRSLYGNDWFASQRSARRLRDYRHEGYRLRLKDILQDLDAGEGENFLIPSS
ncbi:MAG TPA: hypothetical protein VLR94_05370, partial [Acidobacteriota bacterium]|nr:hypothetical protein [Acidobacteriota bacterium]